MEKMKAIIEKLPEKHQMAMRSLLAVVQETTATEKMFAGVHLQGYALALHTEGLIGYEDYDFILFGGWDE